MQAKLEPSEFSFILHALSAEKAIGVNNDQLFPPNDAAREALLAAGFEKLKANGWIVAEGKGYNTNNYLMLMAAVVAAPEQVITLTLHAGSGGKEYIFYYIAQGYIVEQFYTADQHYLLTRLDSFAEVVGRLADAFDLPETADSVVPIVTLNKDTFTQSMKSAQAGALIPLQSALSKTGLSSPLAEQIALTFSSLRPQGIVEVSLLEEKQLKNQDDMVILHGADESTWSMTENSAVSTITLHLLDIPVFTNLLKLMTAAHG